MRFKFSDFGPTGRVGTFHNIKQDGTLVQVYTRDAFETAKWIRERLEYRRGGLFRKSMTSITADGLRELYIEVNPRNYLRFSDQIDLLFEVESLRRMGFRVNNDGIVNLD